MNSGRWTAALGGAGLAGWWQILAVLAVPVVFVTDLFTQLGFAHGMFYVLLVLMALLGGDRRLVLLVTTAGAVLTLAGLFLSPPPPADFAYSYALGNRLISAFSVLAAGVLALRVLRYFEEKEQAQRAHEAVQRELDRKHALLAISEARFRAIFRDVPSVAVHGYALDGTARYWNRAAESVYGYAESEALGRNLLDLIVPPELRPRIGGALQALAAGRETLGSGELELMRKGGSRVPVYSSHVLLQPRDGPPELFCIDIDLSELRRAEASVHSGRRQLAQLADAMPLIVWTADTRGRIDYFNRQLSDITGLDGDPLTQAAHWLTALHPDDRKAAYRRWRRALACGQPFAVELRIRHQDGRWRWYLAAAEPVRDAGGDIIQWYGTAADIDRIKTLEARFRGLSERLTTTLESITDAFLMIDRDWRFVFVNSRAEQLLERGRDELLDRNIWQAFPEAADSVFQQQYERAVDSGRSVSFDAWFEPLQRHFQVHAYPSSEGLAIYFQDITERRLLETQLRQSQRLESVGQLTGGIAHDFNNLLTVILGNAEVLGEHLQAHDPSRELTEMIASAARRGAELTQRLLAFARRQALEPRSVDADRLLADMDTLLRRTLGKHIELEMSRAADLWRAMVDPSQLENALLNLCINARDAMPAGGCLTLEAANARLDADYCEQFSDLMPGEYVMMAVSDTGTGIAAEHLERVFEPFFTTKETGKGTGLGLSMIYGFIKQSRGHVRIYSEPGHGTTVRMYLPRHTGAAAPLPEDEGDQALRGNETILLVEDDDLVRHYAQGQLLALGYRVIAVSNGPDAMAVITGSADIDLLFTDVMMPGGMTGRDLAVAARRHRPGLKVLYTSGYTESAIVHQGRLDAGVHLLSKPYRRADLARCVREALQQNGQHGESAGTCDC